MKEIIFFSNNKNKVLEISNLFLNSNIRILNIVDSYNVKSPKEVGKTFEENAKIKSNYGFKRFKKICFADDSGICIEALNGGPGINSKKYLESKKNSNDILKEIINISKKTNNFKAYFQTTICLTLNMKKQIFFTGKINGKISSQIRGRGGFGYDPIFVPNGQKITFAEMSTEKKNFLSHRFIATNKLKKYIDKLV